MILLKITEVYSGGLQMSVVCLVVEFHLRGSDLNRTACLVVHQKSKKYFKQKKKKTNNFMLFHLHHLYLEDNSISAPFH